MPARSIAAITFTNKSAREMRERVARRIKGDAAEGLTVSTFHALGLKLLQIDHAKLGLQARLLDLRQRRQQRAAQGPVAAGQQARRDRRRAATWSRARRTPACRRSRRRPRRTARANTKRRRCTRATRRGWPTFNAVDFDDLIRLPLQLLESDAECARAPGASASATCWSTNARTPTTRSTGCSRRWPGRARRFHLRGRRRPVDLRLARRQSGEPDAARAATSRTLQDDQARAELPLQQPHPARGQRADRAQPARTPQEAVERTGRRRADPRLGMQGRRARSRAGRRQIAVTWQQKHKARWSDFAILYRGNLQSRPLEKALRWRACRITSPAAPRSSTAPRSRTRWPSCACSTNPERRRRVPARGQRRPSAKSARPRWRSSAEIAQRAHMLAARRDAQRSAC